MKTVLLTSIIVSLSGAAIANDNVSSKAERSNAYTGVTEPTTPTFPDSQRELKSVSYSFPISDINQLDFSQKQAHVQSRQYKVDVSGAQLKSGVTLNTSAKGALVRISAFDGKSAIEPKQLSVKTSAGKLYKQGKAFDTLVNSDVMQKNGMGFQRGTTGFKLDDSLGAGAFTLKADNIIANNSKYRVNVFEKNSDTEMHLTANKSNYLKGQALKVDAKVFNLGRAEKIVSIKGQLVSPSGKVHKVSFSPSKEGYVLNKPLDMTADSIPGALWELHTEVQAKINGQLVQRNGQLPFAFAQKTASIQAKPVLSGQKQSPIATIPVNAKVDGRYEVRAILYGTVSDGTMKPIMMTHSAANLAAGEGVLMMKFDPQFLATSGATAPYKIEQLELRDQNQMALIQ